MLQAILRGKLSREQENMEDVLTSNVFGLLRYVPPHEGLLPLLSHAKSIDGSRPLAPRLADREVEVRTSDYAFWPRWTECEPDVVIRIRPPSGRQLLVLVEAKYKSGKSSKADEENKDPSDQLAREWGNLVRVAGEEDAEPFLIYLTASIGFPKSDIEASIREYRQKRPMDSGPPQILALSWRQVTELFRQSADPILRDLCELADRMRLRFFHGVHTPERQKWSWRYDPLPSRWTRLNQAPAIKWSFQR